MTEKVEDDAASDDEVVDVETNFAKTMRLLANAKPKTAVKSKAAPPKEPTTSKTPTSIKNEHCASPPAAPVSSRAASPPAAPFAVPGKPFAKAGEEEGEDDGVIQSVKRGRGRPRTTRDLTADAEEDVSGLQSEFNGHHGNLTKLFDCQQLVCTALDPAALRK